MSSESLQLTSDELRLLRSREKGLLLLAMLKMGEMMVFGSYAQKYMIEPKEGQEIHKGYLFIKCKGGNVPNSTNADDYTFKVGDGSWMSRNEFVDYCINEYEKEAARALVVNSLLGILQGDVKPEEFRQQVDRLQRASTVSRPKSFGVGYKKSLV